MKMIFFLLALIANPLFSKPVLNLNGLYIYDAPEVLTYKNNNDSRKILLIFSSQKCSHCNVLKHNLAVLSSKTKAELSNRYIIAISEDNIDMLKTFMVTQTPTMFVMNQNRQLLIQPMQGIPVDMNEVITYLFEVSKI